jgi:uncharacterized protein
MARPRNLILAGGIYHPAAESGPALADMLGEIGWDSEVVVDVEAGLKRLAAGAFQRLTVACLRFTMTQHEKYAPFRAEWAMSLSAAGRETLTRWVAAGNGVLGIHTAPICFDDWEGWGEVLGVTWRWGVSHHPPLGLISARPVGDHPIVAGAKPFAATDEVYTALEVQPWMTPLMEARRALPAEGAGEWRPVGLAGEHGRARRAWCGLGHDAASLNQPENRRIIQRAARWVAREM